jgi:uncharacterized RDD family membrane protein YckC
MDRTPVQMTAAVPNLETVEMPAPVIPAAPRPQLVPEAPKRNTERPSGPGFQAHLFGPGPVVAPREARTAGGARPADTAVSAPTPKKPRMRRDHSQQQTLNLQEARVQKPVQSVVYCDNPVALAAHRAMAAAIDMAIVAAALGVFFVTFRAIGADLVITKATAPYYLGAAILISVFYRALFCIADFDTPGLSWSGLKLISFDGRTPSRRHRWLRLLGGFVSTVAAGIGLLWALVDEEKLTWQDRISTTFPTPRFY